MDCGNCGADLKGSMFKPNDEMTPSQLSLLNEYFEPVRSSGCQKCSGADLQSAKDQLDAEAAQLSGKFSETLVHIPLSSIHSPAEWSYRVVDLVTAQSTTGTGVVSDLMSSFTDLFGVQSGTYNTKIASGENICKARLRAAALNAGANAIVAVDIDYAQVGGASAMLMVCMTGTAVHLANPDVISPGTAEKFDALVVLKTRLNQLAPLHRVDLRPSSQQFR